jgi:xanthine dehydrogenase YagS FAD-binding subunit
MCVALAALNAVVQVTGPKGSRVIAFEDFHRLPGNTPQIETNLHPGELVTSIDLPAPITGSRAHYLKVRDRNSYAFALVSAAAVLDLSEDRTVKSIHIALGGVAHKPWRARHAESALTGHVLEARRLRRAAELELADAKSYSDNAFKVELAKRAIIRAVTTAAA